jgi:hypothetical protein
VWALEDTSSFAAGFVTMLAEAGEDTVEIPGQKRSRRTKNDRIDAVQAARTALAAQCVAYIFLHPTARTLFDDWEGQLRICVTHLRALSSLERDGELILKSSHFAGLWRRYDVHGHTRGHKTFHHPEVGDLTLGHQSMALNGRPGQALIAHCAEPGPPEHDAITLLDRSDADHISVLEV